MKNEIKHTSHSIYRLETHIVFVPKYRREIIYGQNHIHMLISYSPYLGISQLVGFLKGKSSLMIFDRHANILFILVLGTVKRIGKILQRMFFFAHRFACTPVIVAIAESEKVVLKILHSFRLRGV